MTDTAADAALASIPIDLVYTFVDGSDPAYLARRHSFVAGKAGKSPEKAIWYKDVGEITYSIRSALKFLPWLRSIVVVTDGQMPPVDGELLTSGRVRVVDHRDIIPEAFRPTFASTIIESCLYRIPGLSEVYLYNNDDFFHGSAAARSDFLDLGDDSKPVLKLRTAPALLREISRSAAEMTASLLPAPNPYTCGISNSARLLRKAGLPWRDIVVPRHVTQVYRISTALEVERRFGAELDAARALHMKTRKQLSWSTLAYSAERHWRGGRVSSIADLLRRGREELFLDFSRGFPRGLPERRWRIAETTDAKFICMNNVTSSDSERFRRLMVTRGLAEYDHE